MRNMNKWVICTYAGKYGTNGKVFGKDIRVGDMVRLTTKHVVLLGVVHAIDLNHFIFRIGTKTQYAIEYNTISSITQE